MCLVNAEQAAARVDAAITPVVSEFFDAFVQAGLISGDPTEIATQVADFVKLILSQRWTGEGSLTVWDVAPVGPAEDGEPIALYRRKLAFFLKELPNITGDRERLSLQRNITETVDMINQFAGYTPKSTGAAAEAQQGRDRAELEQLRTEEAVTSDSMRKFALQQRIKELKTKLGM